MEREKRGRREGRKEEGRERVMMKCGEKERRRKERRRDGREEEGEEMEELSLSPRGYHLYKRPPPASRTLKGLGFGLGS